MLEDVDKVDSVRGFLFRLSNRHPDNDTHDFFAALRTTIGAVKSLKSQIYPELRVISIRLQDIVDY